MNKLLIVSRQQASYEKWLTQAQLPKLEVTEDPKQATIILADPPKIAAHLDTYPALRWLQSTYAGIDALTQPGLRQDYTLTNIRGHFGQLIAEYVMGYALDHTRHLSLYQQQQSPAQWQPHPYSSLSNRTMVILGTGMIGSHLAGMARAFGLTVIGVNRSGLTETPSFSRVYPLPKLTEALAQADIVVSTLPATADTDALLNEHSLSHCHNALLFNVGRGNAVSETGLLNALGSNNVQHAYLDVFNQEPLPEAHPFWQHPQITVTPHIAAESFPEQIIEIFKANYLRYIADQPLHYQIDFTRGY